MPEVKRVALVTGGARGLGLAIAERLGQDGFELALGDVQIDLARKAASQLSAAGRKAAAFALDVASEADVARAYAEIDKTFGRLDVLVNNAGVLGLDKGQRPYVETMSLELWQQTIDVNLTGTFLATRAAIPLMKRNKWGRIVNISSRAARVRSGLGNSNYAASKAGLIGFSRVVAGEVGRDGITVNCIAPSRIRTEMTLAASSSEMNFDRSIADTVVGRLAEPIDVANAVAYLCSDQASFISGTILDVSGGAYMP